MVEVHVRPHVQTFAADLPRIALTAAVFGALIAFFTGDNFVLNIMTYTFLFAGLATAWNIIGGFGGQFSLCHGVFFAIGAYTTARLFLEASVSPWIALFPAALLSAIVAMLIAWPAFRLRGPFFAIATMAFNEVVFVLANYFDSITGGPQGLTVPFRFGLVNMIFLSRQSYAILMLGFLIVCLLVSLFVLRSRLGYYLQAVRDNEDAARASGIDVLATKLFGIAVSAALTGIGGALFTMYVRIIDPPTLLTLSEVGVKFALVALIGGVGTAYGPMFGALLVIPLESLLRAKLGDLVPGSNLIILGLVLVLASLFLKRGLVGAFNNILAWNVRRRRRA